MDKFSLYVPNFLPDKELPVLKKDNSVAGCGAALAVRLVGKAAGDVLGRATCERASESGFLGGQTAAAVLKIKTGKREVYICLDEEPEAALESAVKKTQPAVAVAEGYEYVATASPSYPFDLYDKVQRACETEGKSYVHILCPSPAGWQFSPEDTVKLGFWAVESGAFPLYEVASGHYNITIKIMKQRDIGEYISAQGRFEKAGEEQIEKAAETAAKENQKLAENVESDLSYTYETTGPVY